MAGGEGFEFCECGFADVNCKGFAIGRGSGGYAPLWCWEHNVGGELGYVGFGALWKRRERSNWLAEKANLREDDGLVTLR